MQSVDTVIHARWVIPVEPDQRQVLENTCVVVNQGRIVEILDSQTATSKYQAQSVHKFHQHVLIPGLINSHTHAAMSLLRGLADDLPLMDWLNKHIWPAEKRWIDTEFIHDGTQLAAAEMLRSGTTCFNDMYFFPDVVARSASNCGIRAVVGLIVLDFPTAWARDSEEYIQKGLTLHDELHCDPLIHTAFAPHAPYTVSDKPLNRLQILNNELDLPIHMHVHETAHEIEQSLKQFGVRPLARLHKLGLVNPNLVAVHATQLEEQEIKLLAQQGANVVHCPESNLKLASGFCPIAALHQADINIALGTDGAASNNDLDMLGEMHTGALLSKCVALSAGAMPAHEILKMATINGARALGLDQEIGSLLSGKAADLVVIKMDDIETQPMYNPISQLVYAAGREHVTDVWVNGQHVLSQRQLTTLDQNSILDNVQKWQQKILQLDQHCR